MMSSSKLAQLCLTFCVAFLFCPSVHSHLQVGFYRNARRRADSTVRDALRQDRGVASGLVRLRFHDCFVRTGGIDYDVPAGRRDGTVSLASQRLFPTYLPLPLMSINSLKYFQTRVSLKKKWLRTLSASLKQSCKRDSTNPNLEVPMDTRTPTVNDVNYDRDILANRGLFTSDQTLLTNQQQQVK
ncbi:hypothetical protein NC651_027856 [Populus alba x Populus x berolinensis]|nr:hypothetical protein NC651_027856 [Populus alba x Populus x berolinensis]